MDVIIPSSSAEEAPPSADLVIDGTYYPKSIYTVYWRDGGKNRYLFQDDIQFMFQDGENYQFEG
ncbi:MAG: hypothetical protein KAS32_06945 [Candidatus Peribacteraceae bacterium]|nr:hypothetical protein [Candidatus Peribacteraceae bacterium]